MKKLLRNIQNARDAQAQMATNLRQQGLMEDYYEASAVVVAYDAVLSTIRIHLAEQVHYVRGLVTQSEEAEHRAQQEGRSGDFWAGEAAAYRHILDRLEVN